MKVCSVCQKCYDDSIIICTSENHGTLTEERHGDCQVVKGYRIDTQIESGSPVELYQATHLASEKNVLLRIIKAGNSKAELRKELELVAEIENPKLERIFEFGGFGENEVYVVTEDIKSESLKTLLKRVTRLPERGAIKIARQICEGLEALHQVGAIHRNINPSNIKVIDSENFTIQLQQFDFGGFIQKFVIRGADKIDSRTEILGYYSPEQFSEKEIDFKSDIYSLGVVFYEMLIGHSPFDPVNSQTIKDYVFNESDVDGLHHDLRALIAHTLKEALQTRSDLRSRSTSNLSSQLRHLQLVATPPEVISRQSAAVPDSNEKGKGKKEKVVETKNDLKLTKFSDLKKIGLEESEIENESKKPEGLDRHNVEFNKNYEDEEFEDELVKEYFNPKFYREGSILEKGPDGERLVKNEILLDSNEKFVKTNSVLFKQNYFYLVGVTAFILIGVLFFGSSFTGPNESASDPGQKSADPKKIGTARNEQEKIGEKRMEAGVNDEAADLLNTNLEDSGPDSSTLTKNEAEKSGGVESVSMLGKSKERIKSKKGTPDKTLKKRVKNKKPTNRKLSLPFKDKIIIIGNKKKPKQNKKEKNGDGLTRPRVVSDVKIYY